MSSATSTSSLQPWQFFVLAALASATGAIFVVQARGITAVVLLTVLIGAAALVGVTALRTFRPLASAQDDQPPLVGERTREALEREKMLTLRALKELEFDRAMGKLSPEDFVEMTGRLRSRATRLIRQIDLGAGYRELVERDLAFRLAQNAVSPPPRGAEAPAEPTVTSPAQVEGARRRACGSCGTSNDLDARFCKECGEKL